MSTSTKIKTYLEKKNILIDGVLFDLPKLINWNAAISENKEKWQPDKR